MSEGLRQLPRSIIAVAAVLGIAAAGIVLWLTGPLNFGSCPCYSAPSPWCTVNPCPGQEVLNVESFKINTPTNVTLNIRNIGAVWTTLVAYTVKDARNDLYSRSPWAGPSMAPNDLKGTSFEIDGQAFTFQSGASYSIDIVTQRNNHFSFPITA